MAFLTCPAIPARWGWIPVARWGLGQMPKDAQPGNGAKTQPGPDCFLPNPGRKDKASCLRLTLLSLQSLTAHWISTISCVPLRASPLLLGPQAQCPHMPPPSVPKSFSTCSFSGVVLWGRVVLGCWGALQVGVRLPGCARPSGGC